MEIKERLALTAIHMKQANIGLAVKSLFDISPQEYRGRDDNFFEFINAGSVDGGFCINGYEDYIRAYFDCPQLFSVINIKSRAAIDGDEWVLVRSGDSKGQESDSKIAQNIRDLKENPNPLQTGVEFNMQNVALTQIFGYCFVWVKKPVGFPNYAAEELWNLPTHLVTINKQSGLFYKGNKIKSIEITSDGVTAPIPIDQVFMFKDLTPSIVSPLIPDSRIKGLVMPIKNLIGAYNSRYSLITSRGAQGILSNQTQDAYSAVPLRPQDKTEILNDYKRTYGTMSDQHRIVITNANMKWQSMVQSVKELMLFEEVTASGEAICHAYGVPPELIANKGSGTTFSNMQTATRNLYQLAINPEAKHRSAQWNKFFETKKSNLIIEMDYSHLDAMQPDAKARAEARLRLNQALQIEFRNDIITLNQWRVFQGDDPIVGDDLFYSEIKDRFVTQYNNGLSPTSLDQTFVQDNLNPRADGGALNINNNG